MRRTNRSKKGLLPLFLFCGLLANDGAGASGETDWTPDEKTLLKIAAEAGCGVDQIRKQAIGVDFSPPETCAACHPRQAEEWSGSNHAYAMESPTFDTFEMVFERVTDGAVANNGVLKNFCNRCHAPTGAVLEEFPDYVDDASVLPLFDNVSAISKRGVSCESCHRVHDLDTTEVVEEGRLGDGVGNTSLLYDMRSGVRRGPLSDPVRNGFHAVSSNSFPFMTGDALCAACHDVRVGFATDEVTEEPFLRLENLVTEFRTGPYYDMDHPLRSEVEETHPLVAGRQAACQDCHMSLYPVGNVGEFPMDFAATQGTGDDPLPLRRVSTHYFTGVDTTLIDFPNDDDETLDKNGLPKGLKQRRKLLLQRALELSLNGNPEEATPGENFPLAVTLTNVGAGHNVVSGFSQERQIWIEVIAKDGLDREFFNTGYLRRYDPGTGTWVVDPDGDGEHDEDLADLGVAYPTDDTLGTPSQPSSLVEGPDTHLVTFNNHFEYIDGGGEHHETLLPFAPTNRYNNTRTMKPFEPVTRDYSIPVPATAEMPIDISVRVRFRQFPPHFVRFLKDRDNSRVTEEMVDRLEIVDMVKGNLTIPPGGNADLSGDGSVGVDDLLLFLNQWQGPR